MAFYFEKTEIEDVILVTPQIFGDDRGFLKKLIKNQFLLKMELLMISDRTIIQNQQKECLEVFIINYIPKHRQNL